MTRETHRTLLIGSIGLLVTAFWLEIALAETQGVDFFSVHRHLKTSAGHGFASVSLLLSLWSLAKSPPTRSARRWLFLSSLAVAVPLVALGQSVIAAEATLLGSLALWLGRRTRS